MVLNSIKLFFCIEQANRTICKVKNIQICNKLEFGHVFSNYNQKLQTNKNTTNVWLARTFSKKNIYFPVNFCTVPMLIKDSLYIY